MICDGFPDCPLLVDEANCCECVCDPHINDGAAVDWLLLTMLLMAFSAACTDNELSCNNHQCVHRTLWCDGKKHCSDSSDEWNCGTTTHTHTHKHTLSVLIGGADIDEWSLQCLCPIDRVLS